MTLVNFYDGRLGIFWGVFLISCITFLITFTLICKIMFHKSGTCAIDI